eukprot:TRINITY_DN6165_c0_g1_i7.p1 TRINITY_DN6165_c0_g1~~TRINITY_DN6165_c0_g1_i7.p1  ORF type:complete len:102 (+),score=0.96 TRINITY_DN6165_c0_g1_i7:303-608(+)
MQRAPDSLFVLSGTSYANGITSYSHFSFSNPVEFSLKGRVRTTILPYPPSKRLVHNPQSISVCPCGCISPVIAPQGLMHHSLCNPQIKLSDYCNPRRIVRQ